MKNNNKWVGFAMVVTVIVMIVVISGCAHATRVTQPTTMDADLITVTAVWMGRTPPPTDWAEASYLDIKYYYKYAEDDEDIYSKKVIAPTCEVDKTDKRTLVCTTVLKINNAISGICFSVEGLHITSSKDLINVIEVKIRGLLTPIKLNEGGCDFSFGEIPPK